MRPVAFLIALASIGSSRGEDRVEQALARVSEEAAAFARVAPQIIGEEKLRQKALRPPGRLRVHVGMPPPVRQRDPWQTREIVSEYGFAAFPDTPAEIHEFRTVIKVDGSAEVSPEKARETLTLGLTSKSDRALKRLLRDFEKHGLVGAATDFGQILLLFSRANLEGFSFAASGEAYAGADRALVISYRQKAGAHSVKIFEGNRMIAQPAVGQIWVREPDFLPLRITMSAAHTAGPATLVDQATVEYAMSQYGALLPQSVVYRQLAGGKRTVESLYLYSNFKKFSADAEIKFSEAPEEEKK